MPRPIVAYLGSTDSWTITLKNSQGVALTNFYTASDTLSAAVWAGKDQATLLAPSVDWNSATGGTVDLTITAAMLTAAEILPGTYRVDVTVTTIADGEPSLGWSGPLQIEAAPGSAAVLSTYATAGDVLGVAPGIGAFQARDDLAGFLAQRHEARTLFDHHVLFRYRPQPGRSRRMVNAEHSGSGPYLVFARSSDDAPVPTLDQVRTWLNTDRMLLTEDIRLQNAYMAASLVYEDQITVSTGQNTNTYAALAKQYRDRAEEMWIRCVVEFDDSADVPADSGTHRIDRDCTFLT